MAFEVGAHLRLGTPFSAAILYNFYIMNATSRLLQHSARIILFTRANCSLCETAKVTIDKLAQKRSSFEYNVINVMADDQRQWRDLYEFDTPVVCLPSWRSYRAY